MADQNEEIRHLAVLIEKMDDKISIVAEGHADLRRAIDDLAEKVDNRMDQMDNRMDRMEADISDLKSGQLQVLDYLARIEEEIQSIRKDLEENYEKKGHDKAWRKEIESRLERIEDLLGGKSFSGTGVIKDE